MKIKDFDKALRKHPQAVTLGEDSYRLYAPAVVNIINGHVIYRLEKLLEILAGHIMVVRKENGEACDETAAHEYAVDTLMLLAFYLHKSEIHDPSHSYPFLMTSDGKLSSLTCYVSDIPRETVETLENMIDEAMNEVNA